MKLSPNADKLCKLIREGYGIDTEDMTTQLPDGGVSVSCGNMKITISKEAMEKADEYNRLHPSPTTFHVGDYKPSELKSEKKFRNLSVIQRMPLDCTDEQFERAKMMVIEQQKIMLRRPVFDKIATIEKNTDNDLMIVLNYCKLME